jgi:hypothetical protein
MLCLLRTKTIYQIKSRLILNPGMQSIKIKNAIYSDDPPVVLVNFHKDEERNRMIPVLTNVMKMPDYPYMFELVDACSSQDRRIATGWYSIIYSNPPIAIVKDLKAFSQNLLLTSKTDEETAAPKMFESAYSLFNRGRKVNAFPNISKELMANLKLGAKIHAMVEGADSPHLRVVAQKKLLNLNKLIIKELKL